MTAEDIMRLVRPEILLHFEEEILNARGEVLVAAGSLAGATLKHVDSWGTEILLFDAPCAKKHCATVTVNDLAGIVRPATADEERSWIARGERERAEV